MPVKHVKNNEKLLTTAGTCQNAAVFNTPEDLVNYLINNKKMMLAYSIKNDVSFNEFENGLMKIKIADKINNDFLLNLQNILIEATGKKWIIDVIPGVLGETIADKEAAKDNQNKKDVMDLPLVKAILAEFKGAKIETLTRKIKTEVSDNNDITSFDENFNYFDEDA